MNPADVSVLEELGVIQIVRRDEESATYRFTGVGVALLSPEHRQPPKKAEVFKRIGAELFVNEGELSVGHLEALCKMGLAEKIKSKHQGKTYRLTASGISLLTNQLEREEL